MTRTRALTRTRAHTQVPSTRVTTHARTSHTPHADVLPAHTHPHSLTQELPHPRSPQRGRHAAGAKDGTHSMYTFAGRARHDRRLSSIPCLSIHRSRANQTREWLVCGSLSGRKVFPPALPSSSSSSSYTPTPSGALLHTRGGNSITASRIVLGPGFLVPRDSSLGRAHQFSPGSLIELTNSLSSSLILSSSWRSHPA